MQGLIYFVIVCRCVGTAFALGYRFRVWRLRCHVSGFTQIAVRCTLTVLSASYKMSSFRFLYKIVVFCNRKSRRLLKLTQLRTLVKSCRWLFHKNPNDLIINVVTIVVNFLLVFGVVHLVGWLNTNPCDIFGSARFEFQPNHRFTDWGHSWRSSVFLREIWGRTSEQRMVSSLPLTAHSRHISLDASQSLESRQGTYKPTKIGTEQAFSLYR
jgi:hypothetical protein